MGRRSQFTAAQKAEIVLEVLQKKTTVAEACRAHGITEVTLQRWRSQAVAGMVTALEPKDQARGRESELEKEIADLERSLGRMTRIAELRAKLSRQLT